MFKTTVAMRGADLSAVVPSLNPTALSRQLKRLRSLGLTKRVAGTCRYYLTRLGRAAIAAACSIPAPRIVPAPALAQ